MRSGGSSGVCRTTCILDVLPRRSQISNWEVETVVRIEVGVPVWIYIAALNCPGPCIQREAV